MIGKAHSHGLEVLLEVHDEEEFQRALESETDLVGINNRNLGTLKVDLNVTKKILENGYVRDNVVVSESGINTASDIQFLSGLGVKAFLIGSAIMSAKDIEAKVREFTLALKPEELKT
jgi:indole-3-glycerol phosphate synthase